MPEVVRDAVRSVCQLSLSLHLARYSAAHDALTNIANRRTFDAALQTAAVQSSRYGWAFTLVIADLNELKSINDSSGHAAGDDVLRLFGFALRRSVRAGDTAARIGGDEFAVILANADGSEVDSFLDRLRETLAPLGYLDLLLGGDGERAARVDRPSRAVSDRGRAALREEGHDQEMMTPSEEDFELELPLPAGRAQRRRRPP